MNRKSLQRALMVLVFGAVTVVPVFAGSGFGATGAEADSSLTLEDMLNYAIEDEFAARAEYEMIIDEFGEIRPFTNIMRAEEAHIAMLEPLFEEYGFEIPEDNSASHIVLPESLESAFEIGVEAEMVNIAMYDSFLAGELPDDVRDVFEHLKTGSEHHLRAFENGLQRYW
ncbi:MAG: DUF2202 domain-containing protein [Candidatus Fermentibacteria bacterium]